MENKKDDFVKEEYDEEMEIYGTTFIKEVWYRFRKNRMAMIGAATVIIMVFVAIFAKWISPYDPYAVDLLKQFQPPSSRHILGTDIYGRDMLSRIIYGTRISLIIGLIPTLISMTIGSVLGIVSGYYGGKIDTVKMRIADMVMAFQIGRAHV